MKQLEENIVNSFRLAKSDIIKIQNNINEFRKAHEDLMKRVSRLEVENAKLTKIVESNKQAITDNKKEITTNKREIAKPKPTPKPKIITKTKIITKKSKPHRNHFIASKSGKKFHLETCPFGLNIKPKSKKTFKSKNAALNEGYKPCVCIK